MLQDSFYRHYGAEVANIYPFEIEHKNFVVRGTFYIPTLFFDSYVVQFWRKKFFSVWYCSENVNSGLCKIAKVVTLSFLQNSALSWRNMYLNCKHFLTKYRTKVRLFNHDFWEFFCTGLTFRVTYFGEKIYDLSD